jgi:DNA mismatch repair ATPase MutS
MEDASRIVQKFILGRGDAGDLSAIHSTISVWESIRKRVELEKKMEKKERGAIVESDWASLNALMSRMSDLRELANRISMALRHKVDVAEDETPISDDASQDASGMANDNAPQTKSKQYFAYGHDTWAIKPE